MVFGGSLGAQSINETVRGALEMLLPNYHIVHICGKDKMDNMRLSVPGYKQFEYVKKEMKDLFAMADVVVSRAGANSICELLALHKPNILVPLSTRSSRGDQLLNAESFAQQGFSVVIRDEELDEDILTREINEVYKNREAYIAKMKSSGQHNAIETIIRLIEELEK